MRRAAGAMAMGVLSDGLGRAETSGIVDGIASRLAGGERPAALTSDPAIRPGDVVAAMASGGLGPGGDLGPPLERSSPRGIVPDGAMGVVALAELLPGAARPALLALSAGLLLASDRWEAGHEAAQRADDLGESPHSAYWHAIAHRREPDPGNASYWLRRVGRHPALAAIAASASPLLTADAEPGLADRLVRDGLWDAPAFFSFCGRARPGNPHEALARRLQRAEMVGLLDATYGACVGE